MVTALHVFYNLHHQYPKAHITLVCKPFNFIFFKYLSYVSCNSALPNQNEYFDLIVDLRGDNNSIKYALQNRPKYRLDRGKRRIINKFFGGQKNEIDTNFEIISPLIKSPFSLDNYITTSTLEADLVKNFLQMKNISEYVVLHIGARDESRRWPIERFAACISHINMKYGYNCILVGGSDDYKLNESCLELVDRSKNINVVGEFDLLAFYELCKKATLFLGNESGPLHIASAANTPIVALFGPGVKDVFYPIGEKVKIHHYFLHKNHKKQTVINSTIFKINIEEVQESINELLNKKGEK